MTIQVLVGVERGVQVLTLNRPDKKNALTIEMYQALADGIENAEADPNIRVTLITGTGDSFTAGSDIALFAAASSTPIREGSSASPNPLLPALMTAEKPIVAAVNGVAVGIGVTMLLHFDLVYAGESATFQMPFIDLGLVPEAGSTLLLPRLVGMQRAADLLLTGKKIGAVEAHTIGLVAEVFPDRQLAAEALDRARALAAKPPNAVKLTKALLRKDDRDLSVARDEIEYAHFSERLRSAEAKEAISAFFEKRPADFSNLS